MCLDERKTERRGRLLPRRRKFLRTRWRRRRKSNWALSDIGLLLFAFLATDDLVRVSDALAFVRFRWPIGADFGSDLADALAVGAAHRDEGRPLARNPDIAGDRITDLVAVAELQIESVALNRCAVTYSIDFESNREPLRHAGHHIVDQRARRSPHRPGVFCLVFWRDRDRAVGYRSADFIADNQEQGTEVSLGSQRLARELDLDPARHSYRMLANPRHR